MGLLTRSIPINLNDVRLLLWTCWKCLEAEDTFNAIALFTSDKCRRMRIFSAFFVQPTYWMLHSVQEIRYITYFVLQFMYDFISCDFPSPSEQKVWAFSANLHAVQMLCPHLWNPFVVSQLVLLGLLDKNKLGDKIVPNVGARDDTYWMPLGMILRMVSSIESNGRCFLIIATIDGNWGL